MSDVIIVAAITAAASIITTLLTTYSQNRRSKRSRAGMYILLLKMEDQLNWSQNRELPTNYDAIHDEYVAYHSAGGNGKITRAVEEYDKWHEKIQEGLK